MKKQRQKERKVVDAPTNDDVAASHDMVFHYRYMTLAETRQKSLRGGSSIWGDIY